jgi:hypothetical protein
MDANQYEQYLAHGRKPISTCIRSLDMLPCVYLAHGGTARSEAVLSGVLELVQVLERLLVDDLRGVVVGVGEGFGNLVCS